MPRLHSGPACERPETKEKSKLPQTPEVVWQQPTANDTNQDNINNTTNDTTLKTNVASQTSPPKVTQPQNHVDATEPSSGFVPWLPQKFFYQYPKHRTARGDYPWWTYNNSDSHHCNPTNWRRAGARWTNKWGISPINVHSSLETEARNALRASGFWE